MYKRRKNEKSVVLFQITKLEARNFENGFALEFSEIPAEILLDFENTATPQFLKI